MSRSLVVALCATLAACSAGIGDAEDHDGEDVVDPGVDAGVDACEIGGACTTNDDCACGGVCSAKSCVAKAACDEALLTFTTPVSNTDGTCLTDLAGFRLYWGTMADLSDATMVDMGMPCVDDQLMPCGNGEMAMQRVCSFRVQDLPNGTVYFAATTYNTSGVESARTGPASKVITCP